MIAHNHAIPLPDTAMAEILSFMSFPELQKKALINSQMSGVAIRRAKSIMQQAGTYKNYLHFAEWRHQELNSLLAERYLAALASQVGTLFVVIGVVGEAAALQSQLDTISADRVAIRHRIQALRREEKRLLEVVDRESEIAEDANDAIHTNIAWFEEERERINLQGRRKRRVVQEREGKRKRLQ